MEKLIPHIYTFILPLFIGNVVHMFIVKGDYFPYLAKPLSIKLLGSGKTYRAFIVMPYVCGFSALLLRSLILHNEDYYWSFSIGFILGISYLIGELPNSFIKRRLGISAGKYHPTFKWVQYVVDKSDSLLMCCLVYYFITDINFRETIILFVVSFFIHVIFSWLLVQMRIKKSF
jgi:CDP-diacylglycerol--serine O-phosphatidyltransferase